MTREKLIGTSLVAALLLVAVVQFVPSPALVVPVELSTDQRSEHRLLNFEGIDNFRDLGGYPTSDGRQVKWGTLYRSGNFAEASKSDLAGLGKLHLHTLIDFRSNTEKQEEPSRLPEPTEFEVLEIPVLDEGNMAMADEIMERIESDNFEGFDPGQLMIEANRQFASTFTPQFREYMHTVLDANGAPVLWHCTAGKDRTGYAAAILLRILGVAPDTIMQDYMASLEPALASRSKQMLMLRVFKGQEAADNVTVLLGVEPDWLEAAFAEIDDTWGSFDNYVTAGLQLSPADVQRLRDNLLE